MGFKLPLFPLKTVLFPGSQMVLRVFEPRYVAMLNDILKDELPFGVVFCTNMENETGTMAAVGCLAHITEYTSFDDGTWLIKVEGGERFRITRLHQNQPYLTADIDALDEDVDMALDDPVFTSIQQLLEIYRDLLDDIDPDMVQEMPEDLSGVDLTFLAMDQLILPDERRQAMLEISSLRVRCAQTLDLLRKEIETLRFLLEDMDDEPARQVN